MFELSLGNKRRAPIRRSIAFNMPTMSKELQQACDIALDAVREHPQCALLPNYRWTIYQALGPLNSLQTRFLRVRLALLSARKVQHVWQEEQTGDTQVLRLIALAHKVLRDEVSPEIGRAQAEDALIVRCPGKRKCQARQDRCDHDTDRLCWPQSKCCSKPRAYTFNTTYNYKGDTDIDWTPGQPTPLFVPQLLYRVLSGM